MEQLYLKLHKINFSQVSLRRKIVNPVLSRTELWFEGEDKQEMKWKMDMKIKEAVEKGGDRGVLEKEALAYRRGLSVQFPIAATNDNKPRY